MHVDTNRLAPSASGQPASAHLPRFTRRQEALTIGWLRSLARSAATTSTAPPQARRAVDPTRDEPAG
jgi:hypothetical protein